MTVVTERPMRIFPWRPRMMYFACSPLQDTNICYGRSSSIDIDSDSTQSSSTTRQGRDTRASGQGFAALLLPFRQFYGHLTSAVTDYCFVSAFSWSLLSSFFRSYWCRFFRSVIPAFSFGLLLIPHVDVIGSTMLSLHHHRSF